MTLVLLAASVALAAVAVELLFRAVGHVASEPLWWHDLVTQRKELQMRRLARHGRLDVCVVGTSMMLFGVDPAAIADRLGVRCYNASIYRGVPRVTEAWLHDFVLPVLRPRLVVIGLSAVEANDRSPLVGRYDEYRASKVFHASPLQRLWIAAARRSYAARFAPMAKRPKALARAVLTALRTPSAWRWRVPLGVPGKVGELGEGLDMLDRSFKVTPKMGELVRGQVGAGYTNGGEQSGAWARMPDLCRSHGSAVVFAAMPAPRQLFETTFAGGRAAYEREQAALVAQARATGTDVIDVTGGLDGEECFADQVHCNRLGRDTFTARLADALAPYWASALADDARGHADRDGVRRDLAAHDGVGADDRTRADGRA
ncbi:MAG TPA: hypothetical protein VF519_18300 [Mycobacteriales bacterium]